MNCTKGFQIKGFKIACAMIGAFSLALMVTTSVATAIQSPTLDLSRAATVKRIGDEVKFLASDELEGRGVNTKGIEITANYIRDEFKKFGLKSGVDDGSYFQPFEITLRNIIEAKNATFTIKNADVETKLKLATDFQPQSCGGDAKVSGDLVFVGYGIDSADLGYQEYEGVNVEGKIVVVIRREPQQQDRESKFDGTNPSSHALIQTKIRVAKEKGAVGILFVNDSVSSATEDRLKAPHVFSKTSDVLPMAFVKRKFVNDILAKSPLKSGDQTFKSLKEFEEAVDKSLKPASQPLTGYTAAYEASFSIPTVTTSNVVGVIEGEGPNADETIVIGGHYDHLGFGYYGSRAPANQQGEIHNGADDNATGTIAIVELARRYALYKEKPKRRLVFIAFSGEERGLLGSYYYCRKPLFPLEKTVAMVNYDMIGQMKNNNLTIFGGNSGVGMPDLLRQSKAGSELTLNIVPGGFAGSDHLPFNQKKIPNMFLHTGTGSGFYHTPDDDFETINVEGMADVIDYSEKMIIALANTEEPMAYNSGGTRRARRGTGYLGVQSDPDAGVDGAFIAKVVEDSPADKAGFKVGDVITKVVDKKISSAPELPTALSTFRTGQKVNFTVIRDKKEMIIQVPLGERPNAR